MDKPRRYQRSRAKGWKMPPNSVYVGWPSKWGNPWVVGGKPYLGLSATTRAEAVALYRRSLFVNLEELRGKNLVCWCRIVDATGNKVPCHADVLLEWANE